jgi:choline dehydrogenase-like flavoprotein
VSSGVSAEQRYDTVIVGSGAAGSLVAARLAAAGKRVLILEAGPRRELRQLYSNQIWARRLKWDGAPVSESGNHPVGHGFNAGFGTGGAALHHYGVWLRLHENDFRVRSEHGVSLDWPLDYAALRPDYDRVQREVGLSGDAAAEVWRPAGDAYPMPALPVFSQGRTLQRGFTARGLRTAPIPLAINSVRNGDRPACLYDGWCDAGCPIGALANPLVTYLPRALDAGAELRHGAEVLRVLRDRAARDRVSGVEYVSDGRREVVHAGEVVVAAFTVQSARILLNSGEDGPASAPGNEFDMLGRHVTSHPAGVIFGLFEEETLPYQGPTAGQLLSQESYADKRRDGGAFGSYQWLIANAIKPNDLLGYGNSRPDIHGTALEPFMRRAAKHLANMTLVVEDVSHPDNRITLADAKDRYGVPLAHVHHDLSPATIATWEHGVAEGRAIFEAAGAEEIWNGPRAPMHIMGGTVMGDDERTSVADSFGRVHSMRNLYVAGPGVMPTSGAVNPTFTLSALASRLARALSS